MYLLKYDSVHGTWGPSVEVEGTSIVVKEGTRTVAIPYSNIAKPAEVRQPSREGDSVCLWGGGRRAPAL